MAPAGPAPSLILSGHESVESLAAAGDYVVFTENVAGKSPTSPVTLVSKMRTNGSGYQVVFDPRKDTGSVSRLLADEHDIFVLVTLANNDFAIKRIPTQGAQTVEFAKRDVTLLGLDADYLYVEAIVFPSKITGLSRNGGADREFGILAIDGKEFEGFYPEVLDKVLWVSDGAKLYSLALSNAVAMPTAYGTSCVNFSVSAGGMFCGDPSGLVRVDLQTGQKAPAIDFSMLDSAWFAQGWTGKLHVTPPVAGIIYATTKHGGMPVWRIDTQQLKATPVVCNRAHVDGVAVGVSALYWAESMGGVKSCVFSLPR